MEGEFEQIIMKLCVSITENNKSKSKCQWLLFPTDFRSPTLPHTNTVILQESTSGTITEPGLPLRKWPRSVSVSIETVNAVTEDKKMNNTHSKKQYKSEEKFLQRNGVLYRNRREQNNAKG